MGGAVVIAAVSAAITDKPLWLVCVLGAIAAIGLYGMLAPLLHLPPWQKQGPFEQWLRGRIDEYTTITRDGKVRSNSEYLERIGAWDIQNVSELAGFDIESLMFDRSAATAQDLVDSYRADPRKPEWVDGVEPPHGVEQYQAYAKRRLVWLEGAFRKTRSRGR
jgi:hypothetical protein